MLVLLGLLKVCRVLLRVITLSRRTAATPTTTKGVVATQTLATYTAPTATHTTDSADTWIPMMSTADPPVLLTAMTAIHTPEACSVTTQTLAIAYADDKSVLLSVAPIQKKYTKKLACAGQEGEPRLSSLQEVKPKIII